MIEEVYKYPYSIYEKYFPNGNEEEFNQAFVTFDVSEKEFNELNDRGDYICLEKVVFDTKCLKTPSNGLLPNNSFRK